MLPAWAGQAQSLHCTREVLASAGVLPARNEHPERLAPWLEHLLKDRPGGHARLACPSRTGSSCDAPGGLLLAGPTAGDQPTSRGWLGGDERQVPRRWEAASPAAHAWQIRTPVRLAYAETGALASQGRAWRRALSAAR